MTWLLVNIDTEEEGLFGQHYPTDNWRLDHLRELPRLQAIFDRYRVRPTYQVTTPVVLDEPGSEILKRFLDEGRCDIGGHLHPWSTQPMNEPADAAHSMPCHLSQDSFTAKMQTLTGQIRDRFGIQPIAYRSGRYGSAAEHTPILLDQGYRVETSICPFVSHVEYGGPDFFDAPREAYWLGERDLLQPMDDGQLLCTPISAGFNRTNDRRASMIYNYLKRRPINRLRLIGILYRLHLLRLIRLNPEMTSSADMLTLCKVKLARGDELFHMTFHSSNIGVGGTPYVPNLEARDAFLERVRGVLDYLVRLQGLRPITARDYYQMKAMQTADIEDEASCEKAETNGQPVLA